MSDESLPNCYYIYVNKCIASSTFLLGGGGISLCRGEKERAGEKAGERAVEMAVERAGERAG